MLSRFVPLCRALPGDSHLPRSNFVPKFDLPTLSLDHPFHRGAIEIFMSLSTRALACSGLLALVLMVSPTLAQDKALKAAAEQGNAFAQNKLANEYVEAEKYAQAAVWYRKAAEQGLAEAQHDLGAMYLTGRGVAKDEVQAIAWYRKAAEQDLAYSQYALGIAYSEGAGVVEDYAQAVAWYRKAAEQGFANAQANLGRMY